MLQILSLIYIEDKNKNNNIDTICKITKMFLVHYKRTFGYFKREIYNFNLKCFENVLNVKYIDA